MVIKRTLVSLYGLHTYYIKNVAIETGFPCVSTLKESDGEGRGRIFEGGLLLDLGDSFKGIRLIYLMFEERAKPMREMRTIFLSLISPRFASARVNYFGKLLFKHRYLDFSIYFF